MYDCAELTGDDTRLLTALVHHDTMGGVAESMGFSTRHTRRLVVDLLSRMNVTNTRMAIAVAVARDQISPPVVARSESRQGVP